MAGCGPKPRTWFCLFCFTTPGHTLELTPGTALTSGRPDRMLGIKPKLAESKANVYPLYYLSGPPVCVLKEWSGEEALAIWNPALYVQGTGFPQQKQKWEEPVNVDLGHCQTPRHNTLSPKWPENPWKPPMTMSPCLPPLPDPPLRLTCTWPRAAAAQGYAGPPVHTGY